MKLGDIRRRAVAASSEVVAADAAPPTPVPQAFCMGPWVSGVFALVTLGGSHPPAAAD